MIFNSIKDLVYMLEVLVFGLLFNQALIISFIQHLQPLLVYLSSIIVHHLILDSFLHSIFAANIVQEVIKVHLCILYLLFICRLIFVLVLFALHCI